jgi:hypothetical protein
MEQQLKFKPGDRVMLDPNKQITEKNYKLLKNERPEIFSLPFITVKKVGTKGFTYYEKEYPGSHMNYSYFVLYTNSWEQLNPSDKKDFIKKIVERLYSDTILYNKLDNYLNNHGKTTC